MTSPPPGWTAERPTAGVVLHQPARGFRYGAEAFWLAGLALERPVRRAIDLGTGSGIIAWLLAANGVEVEAVDVQPGWEPGWRATAALSAVSGSVRYRLADARLEAIEPADVVVSNPPFFAVGTGPRPADPLMDGARFEAHGGLDELVAAGARALRPEGRLLVVVPRAREEALRPPAGLGVARWLRVGRRRTVLELRWGARGAAPEEIDEAGPVVAGWYAAVGARWTAPVRAVPTAPNVGVRGGR